MKYAGHVTPKNTPQTQPLMGEKQVQNNAGGFVYEASDWTILDRFLILGTQGGSYYASEKDMTRESASDIIKLVQSSGVKVVERITRVSDENLAVKNAPAIFALALAAKHGDTETRKAAMSALPKVARTATDLFSFVDQYKALGGGFGAVVKAGLQNWYTSKKEDKLAYQLVKYRQRDGWTHHDVLHLAHPKAGSDVTNRLFNFAKVVDGKGIKDFDTTGLPGVVVGYKEALSAANAKGIVKLIEQYNLPREAIPTEFLNDKSVWEAMLPNMPATALIRNLGKMSNIGLVTPMSAMEKLIVAKLGDAEWLQKSRIHPISVLIAALVYAKGHGIKGNMTWNVSSQITKALDTAFYAAFKNVEPTNKNHLLAVDVSGSMTWDGSVAGDLGKLIDARTIAAAMALVIEATEPNTHLVSFSGDLRPLKIHSKMSLQEVVRVMGSVPASTTDCSLPMLWAEKNKVEVDAFVVFTDNETYAGRMHPSVALRQYRQSMGRPAKSAVLATSATRFSIADPKDAGMLDMVGFSADVPTVLNGFVRS